MTPGEQKVADALEKQGYRILRHGWPDFLCIKPSGRQDRSYPQLTRSVVAVEVKSGYDRVRPHQEEVHSILRRAGIQTHVLRSEKYVPVVQSLPLACDPLALAEARMDVLRRALQFYANEQSWWGRWNKSQATEDRGKIARAALSKAASQPH